VAIASSDSTIGVADSVHFTGGDGTSKTTAFHPIGGGSAILTVREPTGFTTPTGRISATATVSEPSMTLSDMTIGQNLEDSQVLVLGAPAPAGGVSVTVSSADSSKMLVSTSPTTQGSASVVLTVPAGMTIVPAVYVQALA